MTRYYCSKCKKDIEEKVYGYSTKNYKKALCRECQKNSEENEVGECNGKY